MAQVPREWLALTQKFLALILDQESAVLELVGPVQAVRLLKHELALELTIQERQNIGVAFETDQGDGFAVQRIFILGV